MVKFFAIAVQTIFYRCHILVWIGPCVCAIDVQSCLMVMLCLGWVLPRPIQPIVSPGSHKVGWIFNVPNISNIPIREIDKSCKTGFILRLQTHPIRFVWRFRIIAFILKLRSGRIRYRFLLWIVILYLKDYDSFFCESANIWNDFVFWISILSRFCFSAIHAQVWDYDWNWHSVSAQAATSSPPKESGKIFLILKWLLTFCKKT